MDKDFEEKWTQQYHDIWGGYGEMQQILEMPNWEDYGLSPQIIKEYLNKQYEIGKKRRIPIDDMRIDDFIGVMCVLTGLFIPFILSRVLDSWLLGGFIGVPTAIGIYFLTRYIVRKLDERDYAAIRIDSIENYLQDYYKWENDVRKASLKAQKTRSKELADASRTNRYWIIIKEEMDKQSKEM